MYYVKKRNNIDISFGAFLNLKLYGSECWAINKEKEIKIKVTKIRTFRSIPCGVTKSNRIRNEYTRGSLRIINMAGMTREKE